MNVYRIHESNLEKLFSSFGKMVRRSRKCKVNPPTFAIIHEQDEITLENDGKIERIDRFAYVTIEGVQPRINGYTFIGTIDHTEECNIIRAVPGYSLPVEFRNASAYCDHCKMTRRRNETFVVIDENVDNPSYRQIGRNCLADFIGSADLDSFLAGLQFSQLMDELASDCESEYCGEHAIIRFDIERILGYTIKVIDRFGWLSKAKANDGETPTTNLVQILARSPEKWIREYYPELLDCRDDLTEDESKLVVDSLEWARSIDPQTDSDYLYNLYAATKGDTIKHNLVGIVVSLIAAYKRAMDQQIKEAEKSNHIGIKGTKYIVRGIKVTRIGLPINGQFGSTTPINFIDASGNVYVWFASNPDGFVENGQYDIVGTVKGHSEFRGVKQTALTRVTMATKANVKKLRDISELV